MRPLVLRAVLVVIFSASIGASAASANSLTIAWDPATDGLTTGYFVVYGTASGVYTSRINVGLVTTYRVDGLQDGTRYYFRVQAYGNSGEVSDYSTEVSGLTSGTAPSGGGGAGGGGSSGGGSSGGGGVPSASGASSAAGASSSGVNVVAFMRDVRSMDISWTDVGASAYRVEVGAGPGQTVYSAVTSSTLITFDASTLPSVVYYVRVRVINSGVPQGASNEAVVAGNALSSARVSTDIAGTQCTDAPGAPRQFTASAAGSSVRLGWQPGNGAAPSSYLLQVGSAPGLQNLMLVPFGGGQRGVTATASNGFYALRLVAINSCGASVWGAEYPLSVGKVSAPAVGAATGAAPGMPGAVRSQVSGSLVSLSWAPPAGASVTRYRIEATTPGGPVSVDLGASTTFSHANTPPGQYVITVRAGNAAGFGPPSAPITVTVP